MIISRRKSILYLKFAVSGMTGAVVNLGLLFFLTEFLGLWYLFSATIGYAGAFFLSFTLQKFWTFGERTMDRIFRQMAGYLAVGLANLSINALLVYQLVESAGLHYILAQALSAALLSVNSYLFYRFVVFKKVFAFQEKKILIATGIFPPDIGGPATYAKVLAEELPRFGFGVDVISYGDGPDGTEPLGAGELCRVSRKRNVFFRYFRYFMAVYKMGRRADLIYVQGPMSDGLPVRLAASLIGKPYVMKIVGDHAWEQGRQRYGVEDGLEAFQQNKYGVEVELMRALERWAARGAKLLVTPSAYLKNIISNWGLDPGKIEVVYNSVATGNLAKRDVLRGKHCLEGDLILSVGRLVPWKGFSELIAIMPQLLKANPAFRLLIIGDGGQKDELRRLIRSLDLEGYVFLLGKMDKSAVWEYMASADLFVLNTGYEGLPHAVIEAMAFGLPVVTTRVGGNPEVIEDGKDGVLVDYGNEEALNRAILDLWQDPSRRQALSARARAKAKKFSKENMVNRIVNILNDKL
jgi:glycosyltransferase involved in cell wall biosynthesis/putative flippase GtrA